MAYETKTKSYASGNSPSAYMGYSNVSNYISTNIEFCCGRGCVGCKKGQELRRKWNFPML